MRRWSCLLVVCALAAAPRAGAVEEIHVVGLFAGKAVVEVDGARRVLAEGETSPEGVRLISADSEQAVLEIDGERRAYELGGRVSTRFRRPERASVRIWRDGRGMFATTGAINGMPVDFLVDTGATYVAMSGAAARRLGIDFRVEGERGFAETASGVARTYRVTLDTVQVGDIRVRNVTAAVIEGSRPRRVLLGMSFLDRLEIENRGEVMVLRKRY